MCQDNEGFASVSQRERIFDAEVSDVEIMSLFV